jgi:integrase
LAVTGILGALEYAILIVAYDRFYDSMGLRPEDINLDRVSTIARALGLFPPLLIPLLFVAFLHLGFTFMRRLWNSPSTARRLVFTTASGTGIEPRNLNRHWYSLPTRAGLPSVRFHDLRHTCVTLLLDAAVPPHIVQAIAGHSGIQATMSIYAHAAQEEQRKALRSLGERLA